MTIVIDDNIQLAASDKKFAGQLFNLIDQNRARLSLFLGWVESMQSAENTYQYLQRQAEFVNKEFIDLFLYSMLKKGWGI